MDALKTLVSSEARARVLTVLYGEPDRRCYQSELARLTGLPLVAVQRELRRLTSSGLVRRERVADRELYSADPRAAIHGDLQRIVLKTRGLAARLGQVLAERSDVALAWIFGSVAAGTATALSDVDIVVIGGVSPRELRRALGGVEREVQRTINENVMPATEWTARLKRRDGFVREIRRGTKLWLRGSDRDLRRLDR